MVVFFSCFELHHFPSYSVQGNAIVPMIIWYWSRHNISWWGHMDLAASVYPVDCISGIYPGKNQFNKLEELIWCRLNFQKAIKHPESFTCFRTPYVWNEILLKPSSVKMITVAPSTLQLWTLDSGPWTLIFTGNIISAHAWQQFSLWSCLCYFLARTSCFRMSFQCNWWFAAQIVGYWSCVKWMSNCSLVEALAWRFKYAMLIKGARISSRKSCFGWSPQLPYITHPVRLQDCRYKTGRRCISGN